GPGASPLGAVRCSACPVRADAARQRSGPGSRAEGGSRRRRRAGRRRGRRRRPARGRDGRGRMSASPTTADLLARFAVSRARRRRDRMARAMILAGTVIAVIPLGLIVYYLLHKGLG